MNSVILTGTITNTPRRVELPSGAVHWEFNVTTPHNDEALSVPVRCASVEERSWMAEGVEVSIVGTVRRRYFRAGGTTQSRTEVVADVVVQGNVSPR